MGVVYGWVAAGPRARSRSLPIHQADDCPTAAGPPGAGFEDVDHRPENKAGFFANNSQHENSVRSPYRTDVVREERLASMLAYILYENCGVPDSAPARLHARVSESDLCVKKDSRPCSRTSCTRIATLQASPLLASMLALANPRPLEYRPAAFSERVRSVL